MMFISKGIPEKGGITAHLRIVSGGQIYTLFGLDEELWLRGRFDIAETTSPTEEQVIRNMLRIGLVEYSSAEDSEARYALLSRCVIAPAKPGKRSALRRDEKILLEWLTGAGIRLTLSELVYLFSNRVRPKQDLLGEENRQALVERIYTDETSDDGILEAKMAKAAKRDDVVDALLGLLKKKRVVLL
jgi:hypothetical protein